MAYTASILLLLIVAFPAYAGEITSLNALDELIQNNKAAYSKLGKSCPLYPDSSGPLSGTNIKFMDNDAEGPILPVSIVMMDGGKSAEFYYFDGVDVQKRMLRMDGSKLMFKQKNGTEVQIKLSTGPTDRMARIRNTGDTRSKDCYLASEVQKASTSSSSPMRQQQDSSSSN